MSDNEVSDTEKTRTQNEELNHQKLFAEINSAEVSL